MSLYPCCRLVIKPLTRLQTILLLTTRVKIAVFGGFLLLTVSFILSIQNYLEPPRHFESCFIHQSDEARTKILENRSLLLEPVTHFKSYFFHQSDEARKTILENSCLTIASEENISNLKNRIDDLEPLTTERVDHLTESIVRNLDITRSYSIEMLRSALSCRTMDIDSLSEVVKQDEHLKPCIGCSQQNNKLPLIVLSLEAKVEYSQYWKCLKLPIIGVNAQGRLGNVMGEYATIFALHKIYGVTAILTPEHNAAFNGTFPDLTLPVVEVDDWHNWLGLPIDKQYGVNYEVLELASLGLLGPHRFLSYDNSFEIHLFNAFRDEIRKEFRFTDQIMNRAQDFLSNVTSTVKRNGSLTYIGVHGRYTDYHFHMSYIYGLKYTNYDAYFQRAVERCEEQFTNAVYIVASDDITMMNKIFTRLGVKTAFYSEGTPAEDMGLLSQCNHSIITFGSYGFWTAYLGSGITLYPDIQTEMNPIYTFSKLMYEYAHLDDFIPLPF